MVTSTPIKGKGGKKRLSLATPRSIKRQKLAVKRKVCILCLLFLVMFILICLYPVLVSLMPYLLFLWISLNLISSDSFRRINLIYLVLIQVYLYRQPHREVKSASTSSDRERWPWWKFVITRKGLISLCQNCPFLVWSKKLFSSLEPTGTWSLVCAVLKDLRKDTSLLYKA